MLECNNYTLQSTPPMRFYQKFLAPSRILFWMAFSLLISVRPCFGQDGKLISSVEGKEISLSGKWRFQMDASDEGVDKAFFAKRLSEVVKLPGSMLENGKGNKVTLKTDWTASLYDSSWYFNPRMAKYRQPDNLKFPFFLTPLKRYVGAAWYQKTVDIPENWSRRHIELFIERAHWETHVWIDEHEVGSQNSLSAPHCYDLSQLLTPGTHQITIRVDNRIKEVNPGKDSHSITDQTQGNWNGMVGKIALISKPGTYIRRMTTYPDIDRKLVKVKLDLHADRTEQVQVGLQAESFNSQKHQKLEFKAQKLNIRKGDTSIWISYSMGKHPLLWDEFHPSLYHLKAELNSPAGKDIHLTDFGMRFFTIQGTRFLVNGREVFLRGTVENCDFPLTGYAPMDLDDWQRVFKICKSYGLNQMRFHSYCPPAAAFKAADLEGFYLHVEGPSWANHGSSLGDGKPIDQYIYEETNRIDDWYGNHPSFCMLAYGNEPRGGHQVDYLNKFIDYWKEKDGRHVYTGASTGMSWPWVSHEQFTVRSGPRGLPWSKERPGTNFDHRKALEGHTIPYVAHEVGQYCAFPDFSEIPKYTGGHKALNFELFQEDLQDQHMGDQAREFLRSSGELQLLCYKAEIEAALRTPGFAGFELLALNDYSGQGTALVGVLNVFWESKGYVTPEIFSRFCAPVVPLARLKKFVFTRSESFEASLEIANFTAEPIRNATICWKLENKKGEVVAAAKLPRQTIPLGNSIHLGDVKQALNSIKGEPGKAEALKFTVYIEGTEWANDWPIWVYPSANELKPASNVDQGVYISHQLDRKAKEILNRGGKVLLLCAGKVEQGRDISMHFTPVFWNTSWFKMRPPHTTGIYLDPNHPAFTEFPTEDFSNLQWWSIVNKQQVMNLKDFPADFKPIVQPIDTWFMNRRLGLILEAKVGKGSLIICSADLDSDLSERPAARQLRFSILNYMASEKFAPKQAVPLAAIEGLFAVQKGEHHNTYSKDKPDELKKKPTGTE